MKALTKLLSDFITWRWAPTVGLLSAALLYVLVVVGMIPTEIGVPVANSKFAPRSLPTGALGETSPTLGTTDTSELAEAAPRQRAGGGQATPRGGSEFGRRGFSPPLERPDPPPPPPPPPPVIPQPPPPVVAAPPPPAEVAATAPAATASAPVFGGPLGGRMSGMFQGLSSAMRARGLTPGNAPPSPPTAPGDAPAPQAPGAEGQAPAEGQPPPPAQPSPGGAEAPPVAPPQ